MHDAISDAKATLMQLRDAFEEIHGDPINADSKRALQMIAELQSWEEAYGADGLADALKRHSDRLNGGERAGPMR
jgi:hypothetical protein